MEESNFEDNVFWKVIFKHLTPETISFIKSEISESYEQGGEDFKNLILSKFEKIDMEQFRCLGSAGADVFHDILIKVLKN